MQIYTHMYVYVCMYVCISIYAYMYIAAEMQLFSPALQVRAPLVLLSKRIYIYIYIYIFFYFFFFFFFFCSYASGKPLSVPRRRCPVVSLSLRLQRKSELQQYFYVLTRRSV